MRKLATAHVLLSLVLAACADAGGEPCGSIRPPELAQDRQVLLDPSAPAFQEIAPDSFRVRFETTKGDIVLHVIRAWSPLGADRFYNLVLAGFFDDVAFFRVIPGFVAQFGMHGVPAVNEAWFGHTISDEPVVVPNERFTLTYAKAGPNTRTTQLFINYRDNSESLDAQGFAPIGRVVEGTDVLLRLHGDYGDFPPAGNGPDTQCIMQGGNRYLERSFDQLDYIRSATVVN
jgi:peptidyl-prolyl cis-trans isomerase A (cyclophilin A)